jgi:hypothetical protein
MTGFTKNSFRPYQLAFRQASATTLKLATAKVTLGPVTDVARRRLFGRTLAVTSSIKFDTIITLTAADVGATPALLAIVESAATTMAAAPADLANAFTTEQASEGITNVVTPIITSPPPSAPELFKCVAGQCKVMLGGVLQPTCTAACGPVPAPASNLPLGRGLGLGLGLGLPAAAAIVVLSLRKQRSGAAAGATGARDGGAVAAAAPEVEMGVNPGMNAANAL